MASINGVSSSNMNSIYGGRNVISGLASGMDTEAMIENAVSGIKNRISGLGQKRTSWEWKQESYRSISSKLIDFSNKYLSYTSSTNLFSASFFNKAVQTSATGSNASKISAAGKTTSSVKILGVSQLATIAKGIASGGAVGNAGTPTITGGKEVNLSDEVKLGSLSGNMTLAYGGKSINIRLGEGDVLDASKPEDVAQLLRDKLSQLKVTTDSGTTKAASDLIEVNVDATSGKISFSDKSAGNNAVYIKSASESIKTGLGLGDLGGKDVKGFSLKDENGANRVLFEKTTLGEYWTEKGMTVTLDGVSKKIAMPAYDPNNPLTNAEYITKVNDSLNAAFGTGKVVLEGKAGANGGMELEFTSSQKGSILTVSSAANEKLGLKATANSYQDMAAKLGDLKDANGKSVFDGLTETQIAAVGGVREKDGVFTDSKGNVVKKNDADGKYYLGDDTTADGFAKGYKMEINGVVIGTYTKDTALDKIVADINNNTEAGVSVSFSKTTNQFSFAAKESGLANGVEINDGLAKNLFGQFTETKADGSKVPVSKVNGTDAVVSMEVNGETLTNVTRGSNTFDVDGMTVTLNGTFDSTPADGSGGDAITFTSKSDADTIVTTIKDMIADYSAMMKEIKAAYHTMPAEKSNGSKYQPLTDKDRADMSEEAIKAYEEKAKQGILFGDSDLSALYDRMNSVFSASGADGAALRAMGISTNYSFEEGTSVVLDEDKLRAMLDTNPDAVKDAFTKSTDTGSATDGIMAKLKAPLDRYAGTIGAVKGILIEKAGSPAAPNSMLKNNMLDAIIDIDKEIERWETKLSSSVDRYTRQFTQLEQLIAQMNSQSSSLMGLMGGN